MGKNIDEFFFKKFDDDSEHMWLHFVVMKEPYILQHAIVISHRDDS